MAISTLTELRSAITDWMNRGTVLDSYRDDFIALAEARIVKAIKISELDVTTTLSVDAQSKDLPADFSSLKYIELDGNYPSLDYFPADEINNRAASHQTGRPIAFSIQANKIYFYPTPDTTYTATYTYTAKPDIVTDTTNRLLTLYPDVYLFACLMEASDFDNDEEKLARYSLRYQQAIDAANESDQYKGALSIRLTNIP